MKENLIKRAMILFQIYGRYTDQTVSKTIKATFTQRINVTDSINAKKREEKALFGICA